MKSRIPILSISLIFLLFGITQSIQAGMTLRFYGKVNGKGSSAFSFDSGPFPNLPTEHTYCSSVPGFSNVMIHQSTGFWEWPQPFSKSDSGNDSYFGLAQGLFIAPISGTYQFLTQADDSSNLYLSEHPLSLDTLKDRATRPVPNASSSGQSKIPANYSELFHLEAGEGIYITHYWRDGHRQDWMQLEFNFNGSEFEPLPLGYIQRYEYSDKAPPQDGISIAGFGEDRIIHSNSLDVIESEPASIYIEFDRIINDVNEIPEISWYIDGEIQLEQKGTLLKFIPIADENNERFKRSVRAVVEGVGEAQFDVFVNQDKVKPEILTVKGSGNPRGIVIDFSEPIDEVSAKDVSHYQIIGQDLSIGKIDILNESSIVLRTSEYTNESMTIRVKGVKDNSVSKNLLNETTENVILNSSLLAYWSFNDISNDSFVLDDVGGIKGEMFNGASFTDDKGGFSREAGDYAMDFQPTQNAEHIAVADASFLDTTAVKDQITISFWQKNHGVAPSSSFTFWNNSSGSIGVHLPWQGAIYFDTAGCCDSQKNRIFKDLRNSDFFRDWHHYAFVKNGINKQIWIDGELFHSGINTKPIKPGFLSMSIGSSINGASASQTIIDDFAIFSDSLSESQILALSDGGSPTEHSTPLSGELTLVTDLNDVLVNELDPLSLRLEVAGSSKHIIGYKWYKNGQEVEGATDNFLYWDRIPAGEHASKYRVEAFNTDGSYNVIRSKEISIRVNTNIPAPNVKQIHGSPFNNKISIRFDQEVNPDKISSDLFRISSTSPGYTPPLEINDLSFSPDNKTIFLDTAKQEEGVTYVVSIESVSNLSATPTENKNIIATFSSFKKQNGGAIALLYDNPLSLDFYPREDRGKGRFPAGWAPFRLGESSIANLEDGFSSILPYAESPNSGNIITPPQLGALPRHQQIIYGWIRPPESGHYIFLVAINYSYVLYVSTDDDPSNSVLVADGYNYNRRPERDYSSGTREPINLIAGKDYYFELISTSANEEGFVAMTWSKSDDGSHPELPGPNSRPISGEHLVNYLPYDDLSLQDISIGTDGGRVIISYTGILQSSPSLNGPWVDVPDAQSPYLEPLSDKHSFFRTRF